MFENDGLLVVERYRPERDASAGYTAHDVLNRYRGFDGIAWPGQLINDIALTNGLASLHDLDLLREYVVKIGRPDVDLVYCANVEPVDLVDFEFAGFDVGYYCSEYLHYSAILNEVLYGSSPEMISHARFLNTHLLFETEARARDFLVTRAAVLRTRADLERGDEAFGLLGMFGLSRW